MYLCLKRLSIDGAMYDLFCQQGTPAIKTNPFLELEFIIANYKRSRSFYPQSHRFCPDYLFLVCHLYTRQFLQGLPAHPPWGLGFSAGSNFGTLTLTRHTRTREPVGFIKPVTNTRDGRCLLGRR